MAFFFAGSEVEWGGLGIACCSTRTRFSDLQRLNKRKKVEVLTFICKTKTFEPHNGLEQLDFYDITQEQNPEI